MEIKVHESQPLIADQRIMPELTSKQSRTIKPVSKGKGSSSRKVGDDEEKRGKDRDFSSPGKRDKGQSREELKGREERLISGPCLEMAPDAEAAGEVMAAPSGETTPGRQVPMLDLIRIRTRPKEARGRIFDAKI